VFDEPLAGMLLEKIEPELKARLLAEFRSLFVPEKPDGMSEEAIEAHIVQKIDEEIHAFRTRVFPYMNPKQRTILNFTFPEKRISQAPITMALEAALDQANLALEDSEDKELSPKRRRLE